MDEQLTHGMKILNIDYSKRERSRKPNQKFSKNKSGNNSCIKQEFNQNHVTAYYFI